jgi:hypothetical protein
VNTTTFLQPRRAGLRLFWTLHWLAVISLPSLALIGRLPEESAGWITLAPIVYVNRPTLRPSRRVMSALTSAGFGHPWPVGPLAALRAGSGAVRRADLANECTHCGCSTNWLSCWLWADQAEAACCCSYQSCAGAWS